MAATIQGIYIALFGRPADPLGRAFWNAQTNNGTDLTKLINGDPATGLGPLVGEPEYTERFEGQSNPQIVNSIFVSLFGHNADPVGLAFYVNQLATGQATIADIAIDIYNGAQGTDLTILENKEEAANLFTSEIDTTEEIISYNENTIFVGQDYLSGVTADPTTIPTEAEAEAAVQQVVDVASGSTGEPIILEAGPEFTDGTVGNDLFLSVDGGFDAGDEVNGLGGIDTIREVNTGISNSIDFGVGELTSVEKADIRVTNTGLTDIELQSGSNVFQEVSVDFNGGSQTSLDIFSVNADGTLSLTDADFGANQLTVEFTDQATAASATVNLTDIEVASGGGVYLDLDDSGEADTVTLNLDGVDIYNLNVDAADTLNVNVLTDSTFGDIEAYSDIDDAQTVNLVLTGNLEITGEGDGALDLNDGGDVTLNISGAGDLILEGIDTDGSGGDALTIAAGSATGDLDLGVIDASLDSVDATLGSGNDRIVIEGGIALADVVADGGAGEDTFGMDMNSVADIADADLDNFETLELTGTSGGNLTLDADDNAGNPFANVVLSGTVGAGHTLTIEDLAGDFTVTSDQAGAIALTPEGADEETTVFVQSATTVTLASLDVSDFTDVTFDLDADELTLTTINLDNVETLTFTGADEDQSDVVVSATTNADLTTLDLSTLAGEFDNTGAALNDGIDILVGIGEQRDLEVAATGAISEFVFDTEIASDVNITGFQGNVGGDILDFSELGIDFGDLVLTDTGANIEITSAEFDGTITLVGVADVTDLDGAANFRF